MELRHDDPRRCRGSGVADRVGDRGVDRREPVGE
jgi:hypothetical protein